jgi:cell division septum initiation protein DivIVA
MKKLAALTLSLFLTTGTALANTPKDPDPQASKPAPTAKPRGAAKKKVDNSAEIAAQLEEVRKALQAQQEQIQQLKNELARRDQQITDARNAAVAADSKASEAAAKAAEAAASSAIL